jgi:hypothetical protein
MLVLHVLSFYLRITVLAFKLSSVKQNGKKQAYQRDAGI